KPAAAVPAQDANIEDFMSSVCGGTMNQGRLSIHLQPLGQRLPVDQVVRELNPKLAAITGIRTYLQIPPAIRIGGRPTKTLYQFTLQSQDIQTLYDGAAALEAKLRPLPMLRDVTSDLQLKNPQGQVHILRRRVDHLGLTVG